MKAARIPPSPAVSLVDFYKEIIPTLAALSDFEVTAGLNLPSNWTPKSPPRIGVFDDGGPTSWPVAVKPRLRITVWSDGQAKSRTIAGLCMGLALAHHVPGISHVKDPSSILDARDSKNAGLMASFTVQVTARTLPL
ncbi:hypothetical protein [Rhodococcus globerulus]|uniref:DUF3168 domain-containing protein n=1 Tax=Rhodococcus globerulus TaxID=33008 RepID=A0ABU4BSA8_RHOGO|nr:hypothetical protein [Rhodococcus globerulus]MDV6267075.1 hypothetical protein [Rhodococcus globerulus]